MTTNHPRGSAPVGFVNELGTVEAAAVLYLRMWCSGTEAQTRVWREFSETLGPTDGRSALMSLEKICNHLARHGRRPLMCHKVGCRCVGADEACFASFIGAMAEDARDDAWLIATILVRPTSAAVLFGLAETLGFAINRIIRASFPEQFSPTPPKALLH